MNEKTVLPTERDFSGNKKLFLPYEYLINFKPGTVLFDFPMAASKAFLSALDTH